MPAELAAAIREQFGLAGAESSTGRCGWKCRTATSGSRGSSRRFPAGSRRFASASRRWKTCSSPAPAIASGSDRRSQSDGDSPLANRHRRYAAGRRAGRSAWREIVRFFRQRNRIVGSIGTPLVFWLLFGAGLSRLVPPRRGGRAGQAFCEYFFPGSLLLIVLFTAIFSSISIIEDRREGFLQGVLVAPIPRWSMVLGKVLGGTLVALCQGLIFLLLAPNLTDRVAVAGESLQLVALLFVAALALTSLGYVLRLADSTARKAFMRS